VCRARHALGRLFIPVCKRCGKLEKGGKRGGLGGPENQVFVAHRIEGTLPFRSHKTTLIIINRSGSITGKKEDKSDLANITKNRINTTEKRARTIVPYSF